MYHSKKKYKDRVFPYTRGPFLWKLHGQTSAIRATLQTALLALVTLGMFSTASCGSKSLIDQAGAIRYFSDYFVFISAQLKKPLIIPLDINWEPRAGLELYVELKAWVGRPGGWPFHYSVSRPKIDQMPLVFPNLPATGGMRFSPKTVQVTSGTISNFELAIPPMPVASGFVQREGAGTTIFRAARTQVRLQGQAISGWLVWEHLRFKNFVKEDNDQGLFSRFFWFPLVAGPNLYLIVARGQDRRYALQWTDPGLMTEATGPAQQGGAIDAAGTGKAAGTYALQKVDETKKVGLTVLSFEQETKSGRTRVPTQWRLQVPDFKFETQLKTISHHTGYGLPKASGRALYRQGLVMGEDGQGGPVVGMVEMILED